MGSGIAKGSWFRPNEIRLQALALTLSLRPSSLGLPSLPLRLSPLPPASHLPLEHSAPGPTPEAGVAGTGSVGPKGGNRDRVTWDPQKMKGPAACLELLARLARKILARGAASGRPGSERGTEPAFFALLGAKPPSFCGAVGHCSSLVLRSRTPRPLFWPCFCRLSGLAQGLESS